MDLASAILAAPMHVAGAPANQPPSHGVQQPGTPARNEALLVRSNASSNEAVDEALTAFAEKNPARAMRSLGVELREPEPRARGDDETEGDDAADLERPDDPRARAAAAGRGGGFELCPRCEEPLYVAGWGCAHNFQLGTGQFDAQRTPILVEPLNMLGGVVDLAYATSPSPHTLPH